jgi:hypothetical protein
MQHFLGTLDYIAQGFTVMRHFVIMKWFHFTIAFLFFLDSDRKPRKPGGSFKLSKYDDNFDQVMYEIYENNPKTQTLMARWAREVEKRQILSFETYADNKWTIIKDSGKIS